MGHATSEMDVKSEPAGDGGSQPPSAVKSEPPSHTKAEADGDVQGDATATPPKIEVPKDLIRFPDVPGTTLLLRLLDGTSAPVVPPNASIIDG